MLGANNIKIPRTPSKTPMPFFRPIFSPLIKKCAKTAAAIGVADRYIDASADETWVCATLMRKKGIKEPTIPVAAIKTQDRTSYIDGIFLFKALQTKNKNIAPIQRRIETTNIGGKLLIAKRVNA